MTRHLNSQMRLLNEFIWWLIKSNLLKKVRDASLQNLFTVSTFISRCGHRSTLMMRWLNEFIWWLIKSKSLKKVRDTSLQNIFTVSTFISKCGDWMRVKEDYMRKVNLRTNFPQNSYRPPWSPAHLRRKNLGGTLCYLSEKNNPTPLMAKG